ncbi:MAG: 1-(5-phosphoribosyl)-5-[(5-phosphoribosylamino)methylideneamino] imidazole-4-carboxamide isomerase [Alphaproteobacteria bacterium]|nr:1-(5-phosphoribosyl)-5-[(5-phosphoribosylamino)methylideneamino] imidazole-4-carboxamide isomerase [Alphaproteobacteria bacterium]
MTNRLTLFPALDLRKGQAVRLTQGDPERQTTYSSTPSVEDFVQQGATHLHVVNLDGTLNQDDGGEDHQSQTGNVPLIAALIRQYPAVTFQVGGGIRRYEDARLWLRDYGAGRIVVGTLAVQDVPSVRLLADEFPHRVVIAIDHINEQVKVKGWQQDSGTTVESTVRAYHNSPVGGFLMTDIARDGMMVGPDLTTAARLKEQFPTLPLIASGGIASLDDLATVQQSGIYQEAIVGKALYEGTFTVAEALHVLHAVTL